MRTIKTFGLIGWLVVAWSATALAQQGIPWARDLRSAQESAAQQKRLVLLHFWAPNCPPCETVDRYVFPHPEVVRVISTNYVPLNVNGQALPDIAKQYGVDRYPTDVILSSEGEVLSRTVSPKDANQYIGLLNRVAAARPQPNQWGQLAQQQRQQPPTYQTDPYKVAAPVANNGVAPSDRGGNFATADQGAAGRYQPQRPTETTSGFAQYGAAPGNQDPRGSAVNQFAPSNAPPTGPAVAGGGEFGAASEPAGQQQWIENNRQPQPRGPAFAGETRQPPPGAIPGARGPDNRQVGNEGLVEHPAAPAQNPQAMGGFCPVTLVEGQKWKRGSAEFGAIHRGRTYLFTGKREQAAFLADPDRFSPVLSGFDPVRFSEGHEFVDGKREHGVFYRDQIFLFADEAALQRFWKQPDVYARTVHEAMLQNVVGNRMR